MAEPSQDDKSEKASAQKLRKSREQGQVARSRDWTTAIGIFLCLQLTVFLMPGYLEDFRDLFARSFVPMPQPGDLENANSTLFSASIVLLFKMLAPLLILPLLIAIGSLFPGGFVMSLTPLKPRFDKLNPLSYFKRMFAQRHLLETLASMLKATVLIATLYWITRGSVTDYLQLQTLSLPDAIKGGADLMLGGVMALCAVFIIFAIIDLPVQTFVFMREQRMTKREVKEEHKTQEGRPEIKQRIRQIQQKMSRGAVRKAVPTADVVIVNPEHYAVAVKYDEKRAQAPFVIAKGVDEMALFIKAVAIEHDVEVVTLPPLARAIYNTSQVNQQIPAALYEAVASVLAYVLQIQAFRKGRRNVLPALPSDLSFPRFEG
ncbi:flagellar biosynthesis protein FlhB [Steroidobacter agaridevorans]|uniref:Flagellar biosynthetic protein FlhB n=1 Tax=Steroidobacter agaridevorans TaxID=2695856 RepID=A0A829YPJ4_9GAMM|nr:flagellar type III secretion system protein FlhB [Steroidobacter agaridevorans]GFE84406.1 flagellar biosynthesis protein FlhB [Steroidobacter agaridevorans]GFE87226.1 flagellar biosynthesis protein FlhB [Steroidobacter agaridevorans]